MSSSSDEDDDCSMFGFGRGSGSIALSKKATAKENSEWNAYVIYFVTKTNLFPIAQHLHPINRDWLMSKIDSMQF